MRQGPTGKGAAPWTLLAAVALAGALLAACLPPGGLLTRRTPRATATRTPLPSRTPTITPGLAPTLTPTATPAPFPTAPPTPTAVPTPTLRPRPTPTPSPVPTPTLRATPTPTSALTQVQAPTPRRRYSDNANLKAVKPRAWESAIVVASSPGATASTAVRAGAPIYVSAAFTNEGPLPVQRAFYLDLLFDGRVVDRFLGGLGLAVGAGGALTDWESLEQRVRLTPGKHKLGVMVDPTDLVVELDEGDNLLEVEFEVLTPLGPAAPAPEPRRKPNLAPARPEGWGGVIVASTQEDPTHSGALSVEEPTYVRYGFKNLAPVTTAETLWIHLYLDGLLVDRISWRGLLGEESGARWSFDRLRNVTYLAPGSHVLKVEVDATDLVVESDESDNTYEAPFVWGVGPVVAPPVAAVPTPAAPAPLRLPNLVPGWPEGGDGPLVLSSRASSSWDEPPSLAVPLFVHVAIQNESAQPVTGEVAADLYFDGGRVLRLVLAHGLGAGEIVRATWDGFPRALVVAPGPHNLRLVVDPDGVVEEASEGDNSYERTVVWASEPAPASAPRAYAQADLDARLAALPALTAERGPMVGGRPEALAQVMEVLDAGYYLITGKSILDERATIRFLTHQGYLDWVEDYYRGRFAVAEPSEYPALLAERERFKNQVLGLTVQYRGRPWIVVDGERPLPEVLTTAAHEAGHLRQLTVAPQHATIGSYNGEALVEAQAQLFEAVFWRTLDERGRLGLLRYPRLGPYSYFVDSHWDSLFLGRYSDPHNAGYLVLWSGALLDDLPGLGAAARQGPLSAATAKRYFEYLLALPKEQADGYVEARLKYAYSNASDMRDGGAARLVPGLSPDGEGSPDLRVVALIVP